MAEIPLEYYKWEKSAHKLHKNQYTEHTKEELLNCLHIYTVTLMALTKIGFTFRPCFQFIMKCLPRLYCIARLLDNKCLKPNLRT